MHVPRFRLLFPLLAFVGVLGALALASVAAPAAPGGRLSRVGVEVLRFAAAGAR